MPVHIYLTMNYIKNLKNALASLPFALRNAVNNVMKLPDNIQEIHLRVNKPIVLYSPDNRYFITENFKLTADYQSNLIKVTKPDINETFSNICNFSVYSKQNEIVNGFITLYGGNRAGICGTALNKEGIIYNIRDISSINIRIASEVIDCSKPLIEKIKDIHKGVLICGAPCSGKTTILRDLARILSFDNKVCVVDTRCELASCYRGEAQFDIGLSDVFTSYSKRNGFEHAVRCMSPDIIICDEIGEGDCIPIENALKSGASVIASAHCKDRFELLNKPSLKPLVESKCFNTFVFLKNRKEVGQVCEILNGEELYA